MGIRCMIEYLNTVPRKGKQVMVFSMLLFDKI